MKHLFTVAAAALLLTASAYAAEMPGKRGFEPPKTRQEAIQRAKEQVAKLEKMTDEEWNKRRDRRMERRKEWQERRAAKGKMEKPAAPATAEKPAIKK